MDRTAPSIDKLIIIKAFLRVYFQLRNAHPLWYWQFNWRDGTIMCCSPEESWRHLGAPVLKIATTGESAVAHCFVRACGTSTLSLSDSDFESKLLSFACSMLEQAYQMTKTTRRVLTHFKCDKGNLHRNGHACDEKIILPFESEYFYHSYEQLTLAARCAILSQDWQLEPFVLCPRCKECISHHRKESNNENHHA